MHRTDYPDLLNEIQEFTLRRERILQKLRRELIKFNKCSCNEDLIRDLIEDLRDSRRRYFNVVVGIDRDYLMSVNDNQLITLLEYSTIIGFNNELEILNIICRYIRSGRITSIQLHEVLNDIEVVKNVINVLSNKIA